MASRTTTLRDAHHSYRVTVENGCSVHVDDQPPVTASPVGDGTVRVLANPPAVAWTAAQGDVRWVFVEGEVFRFEIEREARRRSGAHHGSLSAPMPATVVRVLVGVGDTVARGDTLIILEAMKMELPVKAGTAGTVTAVHCSAGDLVQPGATLIELDEAEE